MTENPYESTDQPHGSSPFMSPLALVVKVGLVIGVLGFLAMLLIPARRGVPEVARRNSCLNNMRQIVLALHNYHDEHGTLPPAYMIDAEGNRLHSWRALILPYMEGNRVYELIDFTKPWDAPENEAARNSMVEAFVCPSAPYEDEHLSTYVAVVGPEFLFDGPHGRSFASVTDGTSNTIAIIEVSPDKAVHWMSPEDVDEEFVFENPEENLRTGHPGTFIAGYLDGRTVGLQLDMDPKTLRAMLTIAGGEKIGE